MDAAVTRSDPKMGPGLVANFVLSRNGFRLYANFAVEPGEIVGIAGPNGAGKSSTVAAIAGLLRIGSGSIQLAGRTLAATDGSDGGIYLPPQQRRCGLVFQEPLLFPNLTVRENIEFGLLHRPSERLPARELERLSKRWQDTFEIATLAALYPNQLSGGQAQRVALARAFVTEPELILLDEPLSALDTVTRSKLRRNLGDILRGSGRPALLISHDPAELAICDRVLIFEDGSITHEDPLNTILAEPKTTYARSLAETVDQ